LESVVARDATLRSCAIEKARASKLPLYVCFVDFSNAFPWTDRAALWLKLHGHGLGGPLFDWLRKLYSDLEYRVVLEGALSEEFSSLIGILAGDSISPDLWNVYLADFKPPGCAEDITLGGRFVSHLEQADDMAIFSTSCEGLQRKLDYLWHYCSINFILVNLGKTKVMIQGHSSAFASPRHVFTMHGAPIDYCTDYTYVGVTFSSTAAAGARMFEKHYENKAKKAHQVSCVTFQVDSFIGDLPPLEGKRLYTARVEPHLTSGAEVCPDSTMSLLLPHQQVQHTFLQRILGLNPRCMRAFLFSETGLLPLAYRRILLTLRYMAYLIGLPEHHLASCAWHECLELFANGAHCWLGDLVKVLDRLPLAGDKLNTGMISGEEILRVSDLVTACAATHVDSAISKSSKGWLLAGRTQFRGSANHSPIAFRSYLLNPIAAHRKALTSILLAEHPLAEAKLRYAERGQPAVPRRLRICRLCKVDVEDPIHALFICEGSEDLVKLRHTFWTQCRDKGDTRDKGLSIATMPAMEALHALVTSVTLQRKLAWFVYEVLRIYQGTEMLTPGRAEMQTASEEDVPVAASRRCALDVLL
ncbi:hypothetical protein HWV62_14128, partial [Athelia sp. TMB]